MSYIILLAAFAAVIYMFWRANQISEPQVWTHSNDYYIGNEEAPSHSSPLISRVVDEARRLVEQEAPDTPKISVENKETEAVCALCKDACDERCPECSTSIHFECASELSDGDCLNCSGPLTPKKIEVEEKVCDHDWVVLHDSESISITRVPDHTFSLLKKEGFSVREGTSGGNLYFKDDRDYNFIPLKNSLNLADIVCIKCEESNLAYSNAVIECVREEREKRDRKEKALRLLRIHT